MKRLRIWLITKLGGYTDQHVGYRSAEEAINDVKDPEERQRLLTLAVKKCFNTIGPEDILKERGATWRFRDQPLTDSERNHLIAEAKNLSESKLWAILSNDALWQANRKTFRQAKDIFDLTAGKMFHYTFDCINTRLKSMAAGRGVYNVKR